MMRRWSFYDAASGTFTGRTTSTNVRGDPDPIAPPGLGVIAGVFDRLSQRVDLKTGEVIEHVDKDLAERLERDEQRRGAQSRIEELERKAARPLLELRSNPDDEQAKQRLDEIQEEIAQLTPLVRVSDGKDTSEP